jgi:6-phosphogluconate dehydrogenase
VEIGMVGLGRMGANMARRLQDAGHRVTAYDIEPGSRDVESLGDLVARLAPPRVVWAMVPAGPPNRQTIDELAGLLDAGDIVIDGSNSQYTEAFGHERLLAARGIGFIDCGVSGGVWGYENGYALMVGGAPEHVAAVQPIFDALRPAGEGGYVHAGGVGAGHFVKMVHNGIEYGLMQSYAEGWELLGSVGLVDDVSAVVRSWTSGTVIRSWLLDLLVRALDAEPGLARVRGYADDTGEGRWTVQTAMEHAVPLPTISAALHPRFASRQDDPPAMKVIAALRHQIGGHPMVIVDEE